MAKAPIRKKRSKRNVPVGVVQMQRHDRSFNQHMAKKWQEISKKVEWIGDGLFYHEICAVVKNGELALYDPTDGVWLDQRNSVGHGSIAAVNVESARVYQWGELKVGQGRWTEN